MIIQSIDRALQLLEQLGRAGAQGGTLTELARQAHLKPPTARNILSTLVALGYVGQDEGSRRYHLSGKIRYGRAPDLTESLRQFARPLLQELASQMQETLVFCINRSGWRRTVLSFECQQALRVSAPQGDDTHFYSTSTGRILLSQLSARELSQFVRQHGLPAAEVWPEGSGSQRLLAAQLAAIRQAGHVIFCRSGGSIITLAVPVWGPGLGCPAALGLYYPVSRRTDESDPRFLRHLSAAAVRLAQFAPESQSERGSV